MKDKIANLLDVKTIVTFVTVGLFAFLAITGKLDPKEVMTIVVMVLTYYFARPQQPPTEKDD